MAIRPLSPQWSWPVAQASSLPLWLFRVIWTAPTNLLGHVLGLCLSLRAPERVRGAAATGYFYPLPRWLDAVKAVAIGDAIFYTPSFMDDEKAASIMAHELAHTRQHTWLGPLYLPAHIICQGISLLCTLLNRKVIYSPVHDYNPLEQTWICFGVGCIQPLASGELMTDEERQRYLALFGLHPESKPKYASK